MSVMSMASTWLSRTASVSVVGLETMSMWIWSMCPSGMPGYVETGEERVFYQLVGHVRDDIGEDVSPDAWRQFGGLDFHRRVLGYRAESGEAQHVGEVTDRTGQVDDDGASGIIGGHPGQVGALARLVGGGAHDRLQEG